MPITSDNTHTLTDNQDLTSEEESDSEDTSQEDGPDIAIYSSSKKTDTESTHLEVDNDADKEKVKVGEYLTWTYEAKNYGPNLAKNIKVHIKLSEGLKFIKYSATKGTFNPKTGIWTIGDLEVGEKPILKIITQALTAGEKFTTANLTSDTNSTTPDECYEEEEIEIYDDTVKAYTQKVSNDSYQTGNPIGLLILSILAILATGIGRIL